MSKATAFTEIPALALKNGFEPWGERGSSVAFAHKSRVEAFTLHCDGTGAFDSASWHAASLFRIIVDRRDHGETGKDGRSLAANSKRRAIGMDEVRAEAIAREGGMSIGYLDLKRRVRDPEWREKIK